MTTVHTLAGIDARLCEISNGLVIVAARRLGNADDARDAVQETMARLLVRVRNGGVASEAELAPIAWGIARHVIADMIRDRRRQESHPGNLASADAGPLDALVSADEAAAVRAALAELPPDDRTLLHRCFVDGERIGNIAEEQGEPAARLRKRKSRALQRLAVLLAGRIAQRKSHDLPATPMEEA